jgi:alkylresorcinol/alkylpyrone synthase
MPSKMSVTGAVRSGVQTLSVDTAPSPSVNMADPPAAGSIGLMNAMGPAFCSELVLLRW